MWRVAWRHKERLRMRLLFSLYYRLDSESEWVSESVSQSNSQSVSQSVNEWVSEWMNERTNEFLRSNFFKCKIGLTGLHDSPARVLAFFIVWLLRAYLWAIALFSTIWGADPCRFRSVGVVFLLNASISWGLVLRLVPMVDIVWQKARFVCCPFLLVGGLASCL